jgi:hypothetical protein
VRAFVLSTGRCGSTTFARACDHLSNYTSGHETRYRLVGPDRYAYPDQHIEVDNRLSWMLGGLSARFDPDQTVYVHLHRDPELVAESYLARWDSTFKAGIIRAFGRGIIARAKQWPEEERLDVCRFYVQTVDDNIRAFLATQRYTMDFPLDEASKAFPRFLQLVGASGDLEAAQSEFSVRHNART